MRVSGRPRTPSAAGPPTSPIIVVRPFPGAGEGNADAYMDPAFFPSCSPGPAAQGDRDDGGLAAAAALATLVEPSGPPAWRTLPTWYLVASQDRMIPPEAERAMAARAGSTTVEIDSSHVAMISHPDKVIDLILDAAE